MQRLIRAPRQHDRGGRGFQEPHQTCYCVYAVPEFVQGVPSAAPRSRATQAYCSAIHHVPVDRTDRMRGHGLVLGALDMTARITKDNNTVQLEVDKANDLVEKPRFAFAFKSVRLCVDPETGIETTAPVLVPIASEVPRTTGAKSPKLTPAARIALRALTEALDEQGQTPPSSSHIPAGVKVVTVSAWRHQAYRRGISDGEERAKQLAFQRASAQLIAVGRVAIWDDLAWSCFHP